MLMVLAAAALALSADGTASECANAPSRASDSYWSYIEACGCARLEPPSRASSDYSRYLSECARWRERNANVRVRDEQPAAQAEPKECGDPPSRASSSYWQYAEACGCARLDPPPQASDDYDRFLRVCSAWRERNPGAGAPASSPSPEPQRQR